MDWFDDLTPEQTREFVRRHATASNPNATPIETRSRIVKSTANVVTIGSDGGPEAHYEALRRDVNMLNLQLEDLHRQGKGEDSPEVKGLNRALEVHRRQLQNLSVRTY